MAGFGDQIVASYIKPVCVVPQGIEPRCPVFQAGAFILLCQSTIIKPKAKSRKLKATTSKLFALSFWLYALGFKPYSAEDVRIELT